MPQRPCPVCKTEANFVFQGAFAAIQCPRCQIFRVSEEAFHDLERIELSPRQRALVSGWIVESGPVTIMLEDLPRLKTLRAPVLAAKVERLMRVLVQHTSVPGGSVDLPQPSTPYLCAVAYAQNEGEVNFYLKHLHDLGYIQSGIGSPPVVTPKGHEFVESLELAGRDSNIGFCAMWFNDEVKPLWLDAISPAIRSAGYDPKRIDNVEHNNRIDEEILAWIRRSRFVIADLTAHRAGVYFEAGFAMGLGLPVIWTVRKDQAEDTHFDNRQYNRIEWTLDRLDDARERLLNRIVATIGEGPLRVA